MAVARRFNPSRPDSRDRTQIVELLNPVRRRSTPPHPTNTPHTPHSPATTHHPHPTNSLNSSNPNHAVGQSDGPVPRLRLVGGDLDRQDQTPGLTPNTTSGQSARSDYLDHSQITAPSKNRSTLNVAHRQHSLATTRLTTRPNADSPRPRAPVGQPIANATDPRWVLAVRTCEQLEGTMITPEKRERLLKIGRMLGLTVFDANLVIAVIQDQARRGYRSLRCAQAGEAQLAMIPSSGHLRFNVTDQTRRRLRMALVISAVLAIELVVAWAMLLR